MDPILQILFVLVRLRVVYNAEDVFTVGKKVIMLLSEKDRLNTRGLAAEASASDGGCASSATAVVGDGWKVGSTPIDSRDEDRDEAASFSFALCLASLSGSRASAKSMGRYCRPTFSSW